MRKRSMLGPRCSTCASCRCLAPIPVLKISPRTDGTLEFRYIDTEVAAKQWHRSVKDEDAFRRLERFIDQLHWVVRERKRDPV
jgi:hypothetical protein